MRLSNILCVIVISYFTVWRPFLFNLFQCTCPCSVYFLYWEWQPPLSAPSRNSTLGNSSTLNSRLKMLVKQPLPLVILFRRTISLWVSRFGKISCSWPFRDGRKVFLQIWITSHWQIRLVRGKGSITSLTSFNGYQHEKKYFSAFLKNYDFLSGNKSPALLPYPDWKTNDIHQTAEEPIVNVFRMSVDACDRLWAIDSGSEDILGENTPVTPVQLIVIDLKTDKVCYSRNLWVVKK